MTDWEGRELTLSNHERCKGRVIAAANHKIHAQAVGVPSGTGGGLGAQGMDSKSVTIVALLVGLALGFVVGRKESRVGMS